MSNYVLPTFRSYGNYPNYYIPLRACDTLP